MEPIENAIYPYPDAREIINEALRGDPFTDHYSERVGPDRGKDDTVWLTCHYLNDTSFLVLHRGEFEDYRNGGSKGALMVCKPDGWINSHLDLAAKIEDLLGEADDEGDDQ